MEKIYKCPKCGEKENLHFNYDYSQQHRPIKDVLCNECGEIFEGNMPVDVFITKATSEYPELEGTMKLCEDIIQKRTGKMTEEEWQEVESAQTSKIHSEEEVEQMISDLLDMQDRMVEKAGVINDKLSVLVDYFDANATVEQLIERYPNDMELGRVIRKQYKTKQNGN